MIDFYRFVVSDFTRLASVLLGCVSVPVHGDSSPFILPSFTEVVVTPLQEGVLQALVVVEKEVSHECTVFGAVRSISYQVLLACVCQSASHHRLLNEFLLLS